MAADEEDWRVSAQREMDERIITDLRILTPSFRLRTDLIPRTPEVDHWIAQVADGDFTTALVFADWLRDCLDNDGLSVDPVDAAVTTHLSREALREAFISAGNSDRAEDRYRADDSVQRPRPRTRTEQAACWCRMRFLWELFPTANRLANHVRDYMRAGLREDGILRRLLPPEPI